MQDVIYDRPLKYSAHLKYQSKVKFLLNLLPENSKLQNYIPFQLEIKSITIERSATDTFAFGTTSNNTLIPS